MKRIYAIVAVTLLVVVAIWHPAAPVAPVALNYTPERRTPRRARANANATIEAIVYVAGAVARPGLYRVTPGSRVGDVVTRAGGLLPGADPVAVNLAARVADGDEIAVPRIGESLSIPRRRATSRSRTHSTRSRATKAPAAPVDLNIADAPTLATVPGIGATIAARIVALREADGPFTTFDELLDVAGMTGSRLQRAQPYLSI